MTSRHRSLPNWSHDDWSDERLRLALDAGGLGPWEWDITTGRVSWSPQLHRLHGLTEGEFDGTFEAWKRDIHPDDLERALDTVNEALATRTGHHLEYRIVWPDGSVHWLESRSHLVCDEYGEPIRMLGVCMDITERKKLDEMRDMLLGVLGHDLRNPLNAIMLSAEAVAQSEDVTSLPARVQRAFAVVARSGRRMQRIINDLLDFASGRFGGGIQIAANEVDMEQVCRRVVDELAVVHGERAIAVDTRGDPRGRWDGPRVAQVVSNLAGNALTHGDGDVRISVDGSASAEVRLLVWNRGAPIPADRLPLLFQPFVRDDDSARGFGLGLFIVHTIVEAHGGRVAVSSTTDGTTFTVTWPRQPPG